jgi:hypothetical protein
VTELPANVGPAAASRSGWRPWQSWLAGTGIALAALSIITGMAFIVARPLGYSLLRARAFPGFTLSLPAGRPEEEKTSSYRGGRFGLREPLGVEGMVEVRWYAGAPFDGPHLDRLAEEMAWLDKATAQKVEFDLKGTGGRSGQIRTWLLKPGGLKLWMTDLACGGRHVLITTVGQLWGGARLHRRIGESFLCHPDPPLEKDLANVPVVLDVGPGWYRMDTSPAQIHITNGSAIVMAGPLTGTTSESAIVSLLESGKFWPRLTVERRSGDHWPVALNVRGDRWPGWLLLKTCADRPDVLFLMFLSPAGRSEEGLAILRRGRCRREDEAAQIWPPHPRKDKP